MTGAPAGLGELFKHSWNQSAIMRAVTCGAGPAGQGSPPRAPPTAEGSGAPAACTAACRRVREAPCIWGTSGLRGGRCLWPVHARAAPPPPGKCAEL